MSDARPLVAGNWKMNLDHVEATHLIQQLGVMLRAHDHAGVDVMVIPPFTDLRSVTSVVGADHLDLLVGAQHVSRYESGAHTGEISAAMLRRLGVTHVLVGHSERREHYGMDDELVAATVAAATSAGLTPILCVGESIEVRERRGHLDHVRAQLHAALASHGGSLVVAYEPIWAIGTGLNADSGQIAEMTELIRSALPVALQSSPVLYGGSVKASSAPEIAMNGDVDGFLVGGASLNAEEFVRIVMAMHDC